jgi:hypothetical protein
MKSRGFIIGICLALCGATIAGVAMQGRRLSDLRAEEQKLQLEIQSLKVTPAQPELQPAEFNDAGTRPTASPSPELLRLRNQVSLLSRRQRELAGVAAENERLRAGMVGGRTNAATALPPGYLRKSEARFAGYATPEDTLQTALWAMQNRDFTNLMASFTPGIAREMQKGMEQTGQTAEEFFKGWEMLPGLNVVSRNPTTNGLIELKVEMVPGQDSLPFRFRQLNGEWKIDSH